MLVCGLMASNSYAQQDPKALAILDAMSEKYKTIPSFSANISYSNDNQNESFKGKISVKKNMYRLIMPEQEIINNGITHWVYYPDPEINEVNIFNHEGEKDVVDPFTIYTIYKKGYNYKFIEETMIGGVLTNVVELMPEKSDSDYKKIVMHIKKSDQTISSFKILDKYDDSYTYAITNFNASVNLADSYFTFNADDYKDVNIEDFR